MKFWKKVLIFLLLILGIGLVFWGIDKFKVEETKNGTEKFPLKFAVMADVHSDWEDFREALEKVKTDVGVVPASTPPSGARRGGGFVIITGDLTTMGKKSELLEAKKILDESGLKYYAVPGNHDVWWGRKYKKDVWEEVFGESFQSFKTDGYKFILVNNADSVGGLRDVGDLRKGNQKEWLGRETEECLRIYCLVFMHMPLNHPTSPHVMGENNPAVASEAGKVREMLGKYGVKEIFAGHLHFSSSYELGGLKTTIVGAITSERNLQSPKFLEVWEENGRLKEEDVFLSN